VTELTRPEEEWRAPTGISQTLSERLADDGWLIIKFWLHISKSEQKKRFKKLIQDPLTAWQVTAEDWDHHSKYDDYVLAVEEMLEHTITEWGPWTMRSGHRPSVYPRKNIQTIIAALEERLAAIPGALASGGDGSARRETTDRDRRIRRKKPS